MNIPGPSFKKVVNWYHENKGMLLANSVGILIGVAAISAVLVMAVVTNPSPSVPIGVKIDQYQTIEYAKAKCGEYEMEWLYFAQVHPGGDAQVNFEAVVYCIDHETNVTVRDKIPLAFDTESTSEVK